MGKKLLLLLATCSTLFTVPALARADEGTTRVTTIQFSQSSGSESRRVESEVWQPAVYCPDGSVDPGQSWRAIDQQDQSWTDGWWQETDQSW
jgi:hypothetical protein